MVDYKGELEAAHARADALSREVSRAHAEISDLRGGGLSMTARGPDALSTLYGKPSAVLVETVGRCLDLEPMIEILREHFGERGRLESLDGCVTWSAARPDDINPWVLVTIRAGHAETSIRIDHRCHERWPASGLLWRIPLFSAPLTGIVVLLFVLGLVPLAVVALPVLAIGALTVHIYRSQDREIREERESYAGLMTRLCAGVGPTTSPK